MNLPISIYPKVILGFLVAFLGPMSAWAASDEFCRSYAYKAIEDFTGAQKEGCRGLSYPVWSMDFDHHYNWCRMVSEAEVRAGGKLRTDALAQCLQGAQQGIVTGFIPMVDANAVTRAALEQPCLGYAATAVAQQSQNLDRGCGFTGPSWNANPDDHFNWCMHGENLKHTQAEKQTRRQALDRCTAQARETGAAPPLDRGPSDAAPEAQRLAAVDTTAFPGGLLMIDAMRAATAPEPVCRDLRNSLISMIHGGGFAHTATGAFAWQPAGETAFNLTDPRISSVFTRHKGDLNSQVREFSNLHRGFRTSILATEFRTAPLTHLQIAAVTGALSVNLRPEKLAELNRLKSVGMNPPNTGTASYEGAFTQSVIANLSQASAANIRQVCSLAESAAGDPGFETALWEGGYAFLLGRNFGWTPGDIYLEYEACGGGAAAGCEDRRLSGQPLPVKRLRLDPISQLAWADHLIGVRLPSTLPADLAVGATGPKIWVRRADSGSAVASPPVMFNYVAPHVWTLKTDSGFDPGGLLFDGRWAHWQNPKHVRHEVFWIWSQKLVQGAGLVRINCPGCPEGKRVQSAHLASPGDNIYVYGQGFGGQPGDIFLTYDNPTAPGFTLRGARRSIAIEVGGTDWWRDDRIHIRIKPTAAPPNRRQFPHLVIVDRNGRWVSGRFGLSFAPEMAVKVVSGEAWLDLAPGEDDTVSPAADGSAMILSHPTGGCDSILGIPTNTNERGTDRFFYKGRPRPGISVVSAEFAHLSPSVSDGQFFADWAYGLAKEVAKSGPLGFFKYLAGMALTSGLRSLAGDNGAFYIYPQKADWSDANDPRALVEWENTCTGPYADKTIKYSARFILSGPKHLLYPGE